MILVFRLKRLFLHTSLSLWKAALSFQIRVFISLLTLAPRCTKLPKSYNSLSPIFNKNLFLQRSTSKLWFKDQGGRSSPIFLQKNKFPSHCCGLCCQTIHLISSLTLPTPPPPRLQGTTKSLHPITDYLLLPFFWALFKIKS